MNTKRSFILLAAMLMLMLAFGCSDDDNPTGGDGDPTEIITSTWDATNQYWVSTVDASSHGEWRYVSFEEEDTLTAGTKQAATWDIGFRRYEIITNGGSSATDGDAEAANLGVIDFAGVTIDDTTGADWTTDAIDYAIDQWYTYNPVTHQLAATRYVYSMVDAEGDNYLKFRVDSMVGNGMPPNMGTVYLSYYYQLTANNHSLSGAISQASVSVGTGTGYFDFSSGTQVTPSNPATSTAWDIAFNNYDLKQNSGPNGSGQCGAYSAWADLAVEEGVMDATAIEAWDSQPDAPMFPDISASALTDWYNYNHTNFQLTSKSNVYLIKNGDRVYKLRIEGYYENIEGLPTPAHYSFIWKEL